MPKENPFPCFPRETVNALYPWLRHWYICASWFWDGVLLRWARSIAAPRLTEGRRAIASGKVSSVNTGHGIPKRQVDCALVTKLGLVGDSQQQPYIRNWGGHGGFDKAIMLWSSEVIDLMNAEGQACFPGSSGEQLTLSGIDWTLMNTGVRLEIGSSVVLEVTYLKGPCLNQEPYFPTQISIPSEKGKLFPGRLRVSPKRFSGVTRIHTRVLRTGFVNKGDTVRVFPHPDGQQESKIIDDS